MWKKFKKVSNINTNIRQHQAVFDKKYIKAKGKTFNGVANTVSSDDKVPKESIHCISIAVTNLDSVMRIDQKTLCSVLSRRIQI